MRANASVIRLGVSLTSPRLGTQMAPQDHGIGFVLAQAPTRCVDRIAHAIDRAITEHEADSAALLVCADGPGRALNTDIGCVANRGKFSESALVDELHH
jgi:hypothetical protein